MKRIVLWAIGILFLSAFAVPEGEGDKMIRNMMLFSEKQPQEKVYLHTDRELYNAGERVWFRAYLVHSLSHKLSHLSRYVYVELVDRQDSVLQRIKIAWRDSVFAGYMPLPEELAQGDYFLRSYSYWMQNAGEDYICKKKIRVINPEDSRVQTQVIYEDTEEGRIARIRFFNSRQKKYTKVWVEYEQNGGLKTGRTDEEGNLRIKPDTGRVGSQVLVRFKDEEPFRFERTLYLLPQKKDFDVAFLPEGGHLLAGQSQLVAFKAIGTDGLSREVKGKLYNSKDEPIAWIQSTHKGMGFFELLAESGEHYYAVLSTADSLEKRFDLPEPQHEAIGIRVMMMRDRLTYRIQTSDSVSVPEDLYLLIHNRGYPILCEPAKTSGRGVIRLQELPEGVLHLVLLDSRGKVYSQRLCFIRHENRPEIRIRPDKPFYRIREGVNLEFSVQADSNRDLQGNFSIAVTDDSQCERDSLGDHILSNLLLTSDLKGYIEDPGFYFRDNRTSTRYYLDLLMLTQGWTRFQVEDIALGKYKKPEYYLERGQAISGKVKNFWGKEAVDANLVMLSTTGLVRLVKADSNGYFMIDNIAFPDSTKFLVQGRSRKGRRNVEVLVDEDRFLKPSGQQFFNEHTLAEEEDFYKKFMRDYYYDHGVKVYVLDEAVVKRKVVPKTYSFYDPIADYRLDSARLAALGDRDIRFVLQELPGVLWLNDSITRLGKRLYVSVNDFEERMEYVSNLQARDLVSICLIIPPTSYSMFGEKARNGALLITTNPNFVPRDIPRLNMAVFSLLGYQKKAEFYIPRYEVDSIRLALADRVDLRPTVYWNPDLHFDIHGKAHCFFNTSDSDGPYSVILEGILKDGTIVRKEEKIKLK